jgi:hypothetical protein
MNMREFCLRMFGDSRVTQFVNFLLMVSSIDPTKGVSREEYHWLKRVSRDLADQVTPMPKPEGLEELFGEFHQISGELFLVNKVYQDLFHHAWSGMFGLLWGEMPPRSWYKTLNTKVKALGTNHLVRI